MRGCSIDGCLDIYVCAWEFEVTVDLVTILDKGCWNDRLLATKRLVARNCSQVEHRDLFSTKVDVQVVSQSSSSCRNLDSHLSTISFRC